MAQGNDKHLFKDSQEAAFRRVVRSQIKRGPFTKGQRDALLAFINHWFQHRTSKGGMVHPGRKKIAAKAGVTIKTVSRLFDLLRNHGVIVAEANLNGLHGKATAYTVSTVHLTALCGMKKADLRYTVGQMSRVEGGTKCPTVLDDSSNVIYLCQNRGAA
ncbi:MAG TPA: hypothetical protein DF966_07790 [Sulfitobacter sp.]|nr:hypothetical protein [Sulfitobacter sp.]|tara:strand:- start:6116 stop:6592 length:477 start_codon:yes stop_codon:yes gene_type:complete